MYPILKRLFDFFSAITAIILLSPILIFIGLWIILDSKGGMFYKQVRVGKNAKEFKLYKFRSMRPYSDKNRQITVGEDPRITKAGRFIRAYKIDELPQLINIVKGEMSVVGPRPEVPRYVNLYNDTQRQVLSVKPGLSDYASIEYFNEQEVLGQAEDPEKEYIEVVMPAKLKLNLKYIEDKSIATDIKVIFRTLAKLFK